jgi:2-iminobutanoate/2-iminopropanoate deaminase
MHKEVRSSGAPAAIGPYSQAIMAGPTLYMSGQIALDPVTGQMVGQTAEAQTRQVLTNMAAVLSEAGLDFSNLVYCTIYLSTMDDFGIVNEVYGSAMTSPAPARGTVAVKTLPKNALVEIVGIAYQAPK